jgi:hypothetical protein
MTITRLLLFLLLHFHEYVLTVHFRKTRMNRKEVFPRGLVDPVCSGSNRRERNE